MAAVPALPPLQLRPLGPRHPGRAQGRQVQEVRLSCCSLNFIFENNNITAYAYASSTLEHLDHCLLLLYVPIAPTAGRRIQRVFRRAIFLPFMFLPHVVFTISTTDKIKLFLAKPGLRLFDLTLHLSDLHRIISFCVLE